MNEDEMNPAAHSFVLPGALTAKPALSSKVLHLI